MGIPVQYTNSDGINFTNVTVAAPLPVSPLSPGAQVTGNANVAASSAVATLAAATGKTTYITGFQVTGLGATAATSVTVTVANILGGALQYTIAVPAGVTTAITPLLVTFPQPLAANATNTAITVTVPSFGTGNTAVTAAAQGFQL